jgi:hypothetical protein
MPGKKPYNMEDKAMMMKPYKMGHSPKEMKHPMKMKSPYNMKPQILKHMSGK